MSFAMHHTQAMKHCDVARSSATRRPTRVAIYPEILLAADTLRRGSREIAAGLRTRNSDFCLRHGCERFPSFITCLFLFVMRFAAEIALGSFRLPISIEATWAKKLFWLNHLFISISLIKTTCVYQISIYCNYIK